MNPQVTNIQTALTSVMGTHADEGAVRVERQSRPATADLAPVGIEDMPIDLIEAIANQTARRHGLHALAMLAQAVPAVTAWRRTVPGHPINQVYRMLASYSLDEALRSKTGSLPQALREHAHMLPQVTELCLRWDKPAPPLAWAAQIGKLLATATLLQALQLRGDGLPEHLHRFLLPLAQLGRLHLECFRSPVRYPCHAVGQLTSLSQLQLLGGRVSTDDLCAIGQAEQLRELELGNMATPIDGLKSATGFSSLRTFSGFRLFELTDFCLPKASLAIQALSLQACPKLKHLDLAPHALPHLHVLNLSDSHQLNALPSSLAAATALEELDVTHTSIALDGDNTVEVLVKLPRLQYLNVSERILDL